MKIISQLNTAKTCQNADTLTKIINLIKIFLQNYCIIKSVATFVTSFPQISLVSEKGTVLSLLVMIEKLIVYI